eukprot:3775298-Karenia_brevis.AAC.1
MSAPTIQVYDAPQAFESMHTKQLEKDVDYILDLARKTQNGLLAVFASARSVVMMSRSMQRETNQTG